MTRLPWLLPWLALGCFTLGLLLAPLGIPEYSHQMHAVGMRGTTGLPNAMAFNLLLFVAPGALLLVAGHMLRGRLRDAGWPARIGAVLVQLSALAFAAQGLLPLDSGDLESSASRLHALAWMLWWIAFVPGALLLALGARRGATFVIASLVVAVLVPSIAVLAPIGPWAGLAQRLVFGLWFAWWIVAAGGRSGRGFGQ